jgi:hypothetical protein
MTRTADSAASNSSGDNELKSKPIKASVVKGWSHYAKSATRARYTLYNFPQYLRLERGLANI